MEILLARAEKFFNWALTAENASRQGQQGRRRYSSACKSLVLSAQGAYRRRNLPRVVLDQKFMLRLLQHLGAAKGSVRFPRILKRHERAHGESHENNQEYPS